MKIWLTTVIGFAGESSDVIEAEMQLLGASPFVEFGSPAGSMKAADYRSLPLLVRPNGQLSLC